MVKADILIVGLQAEIENMAEESQLDPAVPFIRHRRRPDVTRAR